ncbi:hypothetical protein [Azospirillum largimobile]
MSAFPAPALSSAVPLCHVIVTTSPPSTGTGPSPHGIRTDTRLPLLPLTLRAGRDPMAASDEDSPSVS